ncbi:MAG: hypothetical protein AAGG47_14285 [Pseudomonadota bacterium]
MRHFLTRELVAHRKRAQRALNRGCNPESSRAIVERIDAELEHRRTRRMDRLHDNAPPLPGLLPDEALLTEATSPAGPDPTCETATRAAWRRLVDERLPAIAQERGFPVRFNHCFARILLDCTLGRPWRDCVAPPAWRNMPIYTLEQAIALGEAVLSGEADLTALNRRSLALRGKLRED